MKLPKTFNKGKEKKIEQLVEGAKQKDLKLGYYEKVHYEDLIRFDYDVGVDQPSKMIYLEFNPRVKNDYHARLSEGRYLISILRPENLSFMNSFKRHFSVKKSEGEYYFIVEDTDLFRFKFRIEKEAKNYNIDMKVSKQKLCVAHKTIEIVLTP